MIALGVSNPSLELADELVATLLDPADDLAQLAVDAPRAGVGDLGQALREHRLSIMGELRDSPVELSREPLGGVLARRLDRGRELLDRGFGEAARGSVDDPAELVDLPPLDVREAGLDAPDRLRLLG